MKKYRIFILEFVTGGGFNQVDIPDSLFTEGYGMLRSVIADFKDLDFEIETIIDFRITLLSRYLKADFINVIRKSDNFFEKFNDCVKRNKFCFIIAPEFSNILYKLTKIALDNNSIVLSVCLNGIVLGSSKLKTYNFLLGHKISTPPTFLIPCKQDYYDIDYIISKFRQFNAPIIIKPEDGVGAENIYYFKAEEEILQVFNEKKAHFDQSRTYVLQKYIKGKDLSASLMGDLPIIIGINAQTIDIKNLAHKSQYLGGYTPVENWADLMFNLKKIMKRIDFKLFDSFFGLDFIQQKNGALYFIEINPRLTTSYIGLRNIVKQNLISILLNLREKKFKELGEIQYQNFSKFGHLTLKYEGDKSYEDLNETVIPQIVQYIPEIVTPPIKLKSVQEDSYSCFVATKTKDSRSSEIRIKKIITMLEKKEFFIKSSKLV